MGMLQMPSAKEILSGRETPLPIDPAHFVTGRGLAEVPPNHLVLLLGMGCFWGAERRFWDMSGVYSTSVGYAGGSTPNPTYEEVSSGLTGHTEVVRVVCEPKAMTEVLRNFFESHDPTQGMRQGNDRGTQYRSAIYSDSKAALTEAKRLLEHAQTRLHQRGLGPVTTEVRENIDFYFAETYHQQYLAKNPKGYCGLRGTGLSLADC